MNHYFDRSPVSPERPGLLEVRIHGIDFQFHTDSSVFSRKRLDPGSELLIETVIKERPLQRGGRMLDLGCGYGAVGIVLKRVWPAIEGVLCDINERAVALARINAAENSAKGLIVLQSDGLADVPGEFDLIVQNPPIRTGKANIQRLFREAWHGLRPEGYLYLVIRRQQGAPSALNFLRDLFGQAEMIERSAGYWIIRCRKEQSTQ